mmetsp:Transcript_28808/g.56300  ORF Transcript_28808/g.56300 Transcript_28808/m.56300 type:complete len:279 (-) Transcript_28808:1314-2150(-)
MMLGRCRRRGLATGSHTQQSNKATCFKRRGEQQESPLRGSPALPEARSRAAPATARSRSSERRRLGQQWLRVGHLVDALGGGHGGVLGLDSLHADRPVVERHLAVLDPRDRVLHPVDVIALREVVPGVRPAALLASLRAVHGDEGAVEQVLELESLDEVSVPHHGAVRHLDVLELLVALVHLLDSVLERRLGAEHGRVALHSLLHAHAALGRRDAAVSIPHLVDVGNRVLAGVGGEGLVGKTRLAGVRDVVGACTAKDDDVKERVGAEAVSAVHRGAA